MIALWSLIKKNTTKKEHFPRSRGNEAFNGILLGFSFPFLLIIIIFWDNFNDTISKCLRKKKGKLVSTME